RTQHLTQRSSQASGVDRIGQQHRTRVRDRRDLNDIHARTRVEEQGRVRHLKGAPSAGSIRASTPRIIPGQEHLSLFIPPVKTKPHEIPRLEQGRVQHVEMGRDQAHGGGDLNNAWELARMVLSQGTTVDPVDGTVSKAGDAVGPYEFLDNRILAAADYFCQYMLGEDPDWTPVAYAISPDGTIRDTYRRIATGYRGRYLTMNFWDLFYYYTYEAGLELEQVAPHFTRAFHQRFEERYHAGGSVTSAWENVDGGGDFWLHIPP